MPRDRIFLLVGLLCAGWTLVATWELWPAALIVPAFTFIGIAALGRWPVAGGLFLVALLCGYALLGVHHVDNGSFLAPTLTALYVIGRRVSVWPGLGITAGFVFAMLVDDPTLGDAVFGVFMFGGVWLCGQLFARRTRAARIAGVEQARLEAVDERATVERVVAQERARIAVDTISVVRAAVNDMRAIGEAARHTLDPVQLSSIVDRGSRAVTELRHLLGLLRSQETEQIASVPRVEPSHRARMVDVACALGTAAVVGIDTLWLPHGSGWVAIALALIQCSALAWRRANITVAVGIAFAVLAVSQPLEVATWDGFGGLAVYSLLAWSVGASRARPPWLLFMAYLGLFVATTWRDQPTDLPFVLVFTLIPLFAGREWSERDLEFERARSETAALSHRRDTVIAAAVAAERLRIARELHDVSSHAVGVMVLQAQAALAQRTTDPDRARAALEIVQSAGDQAATELGLLLNVLDITVLPPGDLTTNVDALLDRMRASGLTIDVAVSDGDADDVNSRAVDEASASMIYRTLQEALTNAARHAPGSHVGVRVLHDDTGHHICVTNGPGHRTDTRPGSHYGLVGLTERVRALGGDLSAEATPDGGFRLQARIPTRSEVSR